MRGVRLPGYVVRDPGLPSRIIYKYTNETKARLVPRKISVDPRHYTGAQIDDVTATVVGTDAVMREKHVIRHITANPSVTYVLDRGDTVILPEGTHLLVETEHPLVDPDETEVEIEMAPTER